MEGFSDRPVHDNDDEGSGSGHWDENYDDDDSDGIWETENYDDYDYEYDYDYDYDDDEDDKKEHDKKKENEDKKKDKEGIKGNLTMFDYLFRRQAAQARRQTNFDNMRERVASMRPKMRNMGQFPVQNKRSGNFNPMNWNTRRMPAVGRRQEPFSGPNARRSFGRNSPLKRRQLTARATKLARRATDRARQQKM